MSLFAVCPGVTQCVDRRPAAGSPRWLLPVFCLLLCAGSARAAQDEQPGPVFGSIDQAQAAADAAKADTDRIKRQYDVDAAACMHKFFANRCAEKARLERNAGVTRSDEARRQAELYIRREQARARHAQRDRDNAERDAKAAERAAGKAQEAAARPAAEAKPDPAPAPPSGRVAEPQPRAPREVDDPVVRARNRADFERKQAEAREYAQKQARDRQEAEAKRARRRAEREEEAARLKALRQDEGVQAPAGKP